METFCQKNLMELKMLLQQLSQAQYSTPLSLLSNASIGQHVRHILEFYQCVLDATSGIVNYDARERNRIIEGDSVYTVILIDWLVAKLETALDDRQLVLEGSYSVSESDTVRITTSMYRELAYCLEHSIHHQALLKIGLREMDLVNLVGATFGVAPATIRYAMPTR
jgi:uncharacterized damage-inducible protein DinB